MISFILSFLFPQKLEEIHSPINGKIVVEKFHGKISVKVDRLTQSGELVENLWREGLKNLSINPKNILILGFGSGTLGILLSNKFPYAKLFGIEIDQFMIDIGKKYFEINSIKNLVIKITDAELYIDKINGKFDLIIVDTYLGEDFPEKFENEIFLKKIEEKLSSDGMVIFNRLSYANHVFEAEKFLDKLTKIFKYSYCNNIKYNKIIYCKKI